MFISDEVYKEIVDKTIIWTVDLVFINSNNEILLWKRNNNPLIWEYYFPGWRRYKWEKILISAKRKASEELWLAIDENKLIFIWVYDDIYENSMYDWINSHFCPIIFAYKIDKYEEKKIKLDSQHSEMKFFSVDDKNLHKYIIERIKDIKKLKII
jgi:colanic acid biosynthesis protein WcaH